MSDRVRFCTRSSNRNGVVFSKGDRLGPGFKYHIVTVSAIFFALTIGLVAGIFLSPHVTSRQERAIFNLQKTIKQDVIEKNIILDNDQKCLSQVIPLALKDRLRGVSVALIQTGDYPEALSKAKEALQMAGAKPLSQLIIEPEWNRTNDLLNPRLAEIRVKKPGFPANREELAIKLAQLIAKGDNAIAPYLPILEGEKFIRLSSENDATQPVKVAIMAIGSRNSNPSRSSLVDLPLIRALQKEGVQVIACEVQGAEISDIADRVTVLRDGHQGTDTAIWLAATKPKCEPGSFWFDREPRSAHAFTATRLTKNTANDLAEFLAGELAKV